MILSATVDSSGFQHTSKPLMASVASPTRSSPAPLMSSVASPTRSSPAPLRLVPWGEAVDALLTQCAKHGVRIDAHAQAQVRAPVAHYSPSQHSGDISTEWETTDDDYDDSSSGSSSDDDMTDDDLPDEVRAAFEQPAFAVDDYGYDSSSSSEPSTPPSRDDLYQAINIPTFALMRDDTGSRRAGRVVASTYAAAPRTPVSAATPDTALGTAPIVDLDLAETLSADKKPVKASNATTSNRPRPRRARKLRDRKRSVILAKTTKCKQVKARLPLQSKPPNAT